MQVPNIIAVITGGSLLDYQLVKEEHNGLTHLYLYVAPSVTLSDESQVIETFLDAMRDSAPSASLAQLECRDGDVIRIRRQAPLLTSRGKHFPIRTLFSS